MFQVVKREVYGKIVVTLFVIFTLLWFYTALSENPGSLLHDIFGATYGVVALIGGISGLIISRKWGGLKSLLGKAITFFSLGLLAQAFGQFSYNFYIYVLGTEVPYPSLGDIGYLGYVPLYMLGMYYLGQVAGVKVSLRSNVSKVFAILTPIVILFATVLFFLNGYEFDWSAPLIATLDIAYVVAQALNVSILVVVYILSKKYLGGVMRSRVLLVLAAYLMQYASDFTFLYQIHRGDFQIGGINDFMYLVSYFLMAMALIQLKTTFDSLKSK